MNKQRNIKSTLITVGIIILVVIGFVFAYKASNKPSEYEPFAQSLKDAGTRFYGAFWCPHCQAQEKEFKMSRQKMERMGLYVECSPSNGQGQTKVCSDAGIESYPTWVYAKDFSVTSTTAPTVCEIQPGPAGQSTLCTNYGSKKLKTWIFQGADIITAQSASEPTHEGDVWTFKAGSRTTGEVSLENLGLFSGVALPTITTETN